MPSNNSDLHVDKSGKEEQTIESFEQQHDVPHIDPVLQKQLLRKIDWHILVGLLFRSLSLTGSCS